MPGKVLSIEEFPPQKDAKILKQRLIPGMIQAEPRLAMCRAKQETGSAKT